MVKGRIRNGQRLSGALAFVAGLPRPMGWLSRCMASRRAGELEETREGPRREDDERLQAELLLRLQRDLALAMGEASTVRTCLNHLADTILRIPGVDCCGVFLVRGQGGALELAAYRGISAAYAEAYAVYDGHSPLGTEVLAGRSVWLDHEALSRVGDPATVQEGLRSMIVVPVKFETGIIATLHVSSHKADGFSANTMTTIEALASLMGSTIARLRVEEALRQSEERCRRIVEHAEVGLVMVNEAGELLLDNRAARDVVTDVRGGLQRPGAGHGGVRMCGKRWQEQVRRVLATGETLEFSSRIIVAGEPRWFEITMRPFPDTEPASREVLIVTKDVTGQRQMLSALQEREVNFRNLTENASDVIVIVEAGGRVVYTGSRVEALSGYTVSEVQRMTLCELVHPSHRGLVQERLKARIGGGAVPSRYETEILHKDGRAVPVELAANVVVWHDETCVMASVRDIAERRRAEAALRESEALFRSVAEGAFDPIVLVDTDGRYLYANGRTAELTGYTVEELQGLTFGRLIHPRESKRVEKVFEDRRSGRPAPAWYETVLCRKDGTAVPIEVSAHESEWRGKRTFVGVYRDISERKRLETEILRIGEWEKTRIGQDLHDSIGQQLVGMAYLVEALEHDLKKARSRHAAAATQIAASCKTAHGQLRNVVRGLLPVKMSDGLPDGLRRLAENVQAQMGVVCTLQCALDVNGLNLASMGHLYHIAQEAVTNAVRHGRARQVDITLERAGERGELRIDDDGKGFCQISARVTGSGLKIMRYRADMISGTLSVARNARGGMSVRCTFDMAPGMDLNQEVENEES